MPPNPPHFQLLPLASPRANRGADVPISLILSVYRLSLTFIKTRSNGTYAQWPIETGYLAAPGRICCIGDLGTGWSPRGAEVQRSWPTSMWTRPGAHQSNSQLWVK
jgi:hypothetical protein